MPQIYGITRRARGATTTDAVASVARMSRYGEQIVVPLANGTYPLADEGTYFKATNATPGTGITAGITTAFSATAAMYSISNGDGAAGKRLYLDYLTMWANTVPASATSFQFAVTIDNTVRYSSAGTAITPINPNMDDGTATIATVHAGALVLSAASGSARLHSRGVLFAAIPVLNSPFCINFGTVDNFSGAIGGASATAVTMVTGPVIIGPGHSLNIHMWWPANAATAGVWEFDAGWWER